VVNCLIFGEFCVIVIKNEVIIMFFEDLNSVVKYIEAHIEEDIDIETLALMLGTNQDTFKRIFTLICGVSVTEYIKKRRLTVCCNDLKNMSVLDVAYKYGYTSSAGFSRAFYNFHKCYPSAVKQGDNVKLNAFLPIKISSNLGAKEFSYSIENWGSRELFGYHKECDVRSLQQVVGAEFASFLGKYQPTEYCGLTFYEPGARAKYWFCLYDEREGLSSVTIPAGEWLVLEYHGEFSEISSFVRAVYRDIGKQINYLPARKIDMELYSRDGVKLCFLLN